jgi:hypothetical protein
VDFVAQAVRLPFVHAAGVIDGFVRPTQRAGKIAALDADLGEGTSTRTLMSEVQRHLGGPGLKLLSDQPSTVSVRFRRVQVVIFGRLQSLQDECVGEGIQIVAIGRFETYELRDQTFHILQALM